MRLAFEIAQHHGQAVALRQPGEFLVDDRSEFGGFERCFWRAAGLIPAVFVPHHTAGINPAARLQLQRRVHRDPVQPAADARLADRPGLPQERQERRLEHVFGIGLVAQHAQARRPHRVGVPAHEQFKRGRITSSNEPTQQLAVGDVIPGRRRRGEQAEEEPAGHGTFRVGCCRHPY